MKQHESFGILGSGHWLVLALAVSGAASSAAAQEQAELAKPKIEFQTVYLQEPIDRAHRIIVSGELGGEGQVTLEGNTCTVTQFGDPGVCTQIFFPPVDIKLVQLRLADPTGQGRRLFRLEGELDPPDASYFLVVPRRRSEPHRLVVNMANDRRRVVTLERRPAARPKPELCKTAKYRAEQAADKVTIYAVGQHKTAGWKTAFEQLPIRIFPPQYRLVCFPPAGVVAQVVTPFEDQTSFTAEQPVKEVVVHDDAGQHTVPVKQAE